MENGRVDIFKWWKWFYIFLIVKTVKKEIEFDMTFVPLVDVKKAVIKAALWPERVANGNDNKIVPIKIIIKKPQVRILGNEYLCLKISIIYYHHLR